MKCFRHLVIAALLAVTLILPAELSAQKRKSKPPKTVRAAVTIYGSDDMPRNLTPAQQKRWDSFIQVWETLDQNYFDTTFSGLDWKKIKAEYRPRVLAAKTDIELALVLNDMVWRLNRSHFAIVPKEVYEAVESTKERAKKAEKVLDPDTDQNDDEGDAEDNTDLVADKLAQYGVGIDLKMIDGKFVITYIEEASAAKLADIKPGYILDKVNGVSLSHTVSQISLMLPGLKNLDRILPFEIQTFVLTGNRDTVITLTCLDENDKPKDFQLKRRKLLGQTASLGLSFPPQYMRFESRSLGDDIGYIKFNSFTLGVMEKFCTALTSLKDKKAIIIDVRGNIGGLLSVFQGITGMFFDKDVEVGTTIYRQGSDTLKAVAKARRYNGKLVLLVDGHSMSAAELFAAGLRDNDRVVLVGERTAGEALPASTVRLPIGAMFLFPVSNFKSRRGKFIEGAGVEPDIAVALDRRKLFEGIDTQLEKALAVIREDKAFPKSAPTAAATPAVNEVRLDKITTVVGTDDAPPPPKKVNRLSGISSAAEVKDEKAIQIFKVAEDTIGTAAMKKASSYEFTGVGRITASNELFDYKALSSTAPKMFSYMMTFAGDGILRVVYSREDSFREAFGTTETMPQIVDEVEPTGMIDLSKFTSLKYLGDFDREGRKCSIVEGKYKGSTIALAFDVEKKYLVSIAGAGVAASYDDYRVVADGIMVPFYIELDHTFTITLTDVKLNVPIDKARFQRTVNCFDVPIEVPLTTL